MSEKTANTMAVIRILVCLFFHLSVRVFFYGADARDVGLMTLFFLQGRKKIKYASNGRGPTDPSHDRSLR